MIMEANVNNIFSWSRFLNLYRKNFAENWKVYLLSMIAVLSVVILFFVFPSYFLLSHLEEMELENLEMTIGGDISQLIMPVILIVPLFLSTLLGSFTFRKLRTKQGVISDLMLPASKLEKFLVRWLNVVVLYNVALLLIFFFADEIRVLFLNHLFPLINFEKLTIQKAIALAGAKEQVIFWVSWYFFNQACYILGSAFMPSYSFIKTYAIKLVFTLLFSGIYMMLGFGYFQLGILYPYTWGIVLLTMAFWVLAFYRYKRAQVA